MCLNAVAINNLFLDVIRPFASRLCSLGVLWCRDFSAVCFLCFYLLKDLHLRVNLLPFYFCLCYSQRLVALSIQKPLNFASYLAPFCHPMLKNDLYFLYKFYLSG